MSCCAYSPSQSAEQTPQSHLWGQAMLLRTEKNSEYWILLKFQCSDLIHHLCGGWVSTITGAPCWPETKQDWILTYCVSPSFCRACHSSSPLVPSNKTPESQRNNAEMKKNCNVYVYPELLFRFNETAEVQIIYCVCQHIVYTVYSERCGTIKSEFD